MSATTEAHLDNSFLDSIAQEFCSGNDPFAGIDPALIADEGSLEFLGADTGLQAFSIANAHDALAAKSSLGQQDVAATYMPQGSASATAAAAAAADGVPATAAANGFLNPSDADSEAQAKLQKLRDASRKTQKRYRDRKKNKLLEAEAKVAQLTEQLSQMRMEQLTLTARHELLERCMAMQHQQAAGGFPSIVQGQPEAWWNHNSHGISLSAAGSIRAPSATSSDTSELAAAVTGGASAALPWWIDDGMQNYLRHSPALASDIVLTIGPNAPAQMTKADAAKMTPQYLGGLWRQYLQAFGECLKQMRADPQSPAAHRLDRLWYESCQVWGAVLVVFPDRAHEVMRLVMPEDERDTLTGTDIDEQDRRLAAEARFSPEQRRVLAGLRRRFHVGVGMLQQRRANLTAELQAMSPLQAAAELGKQAASGQASGGGRFERILSAMEAVKGTLRDEHSYFLRFYFLMGAKVVQPCQGAHICIEALPRDVRLFAIAEVVALEEGEPPAADLLAEGAANPDGKLQSLEEVLPAAWLVDHVPPVDAGARCSGAANPAAAATS